MNVGSKWFWLLVLAQAGFLLTWAGYHEVVRQHAPVLLLKAHPVDPQDLLRGDYMILAYDISEVPLGAPDEEAREGEEVWVLLEKRDRYHVAVRADRHPLAPGSNQVLVRGTTSSRWRNGRSREVVIYGIEKYFVPEGQGTPRFELLEAEVAVSPAHRPYLKRVLLDGRAFP